MTGVAVNPARRVEERAYTKVKELKREADKRGITLREALGELQSSTTS